MSLCYSKSGLSSHNLKFQEKVVLLWLGRFIRTPVLRHGMEECCGFASIRNKRTTQLLSHSFPLSGGMGRRIRRKEGKNSSDENSLTEWQRQKKTTINAIDKSIYNTRCSHHPVLSLLLSSKNLSFSQLPT